MMNAKGNFLIQIKIGKYGIRHVYMNCFLRNFPPYLHALSEKFCYIFDGSYDENIKNDIYILHFQASRSAKNLIINNIQTPNFLKNL